MEISDEYQDIGNPGGGVAMANMPIVHHQQHTPESPMSHQEEDLSDPDLQDEESGEELPQQPVQGNTHSSSDNVSGPASTPTPLTHLNSLMSTHHPHFLAKLKMENEVDVMNNKSGMEALQAAMGGGGFNLPFPFPTPAAFLTPQHHSQNNHPQSAVMGGGVGNNQMTSSASSHSSESSQGSARNGGEPRETSNHSQNNSTGTNHQQQTSWSFEEQFKQVRQLYEINDDPKRKEFLDDLFSFMQKRGSPINRLPIMAKSVLDLYELYNLVIARGGLVDVINKKLWQEIIKGLHLPSSITSAAFTLRTQYMKYLYPYECEKKRLSTPTELQAAIDGNRREGRRSSYGAYSGGGGGGADLVQRNPSNSLALHTQISPLSLVTAVAAGGQHHGPQTLVNGSAAHTPLPHHPHHPQHPQVSLGQPSTAGPIPGMAPSEFEARMVEYVKLLNKELRSAGAGTPPPMINRQGSPTPRPATPSREGAFSALEMSRLTLWNMYNNNNTLYPGIAHQPPLSPQPSNSPMPPASSPEPQREALDLGLRYMAWKARTLLPLYLQQLMTDPQANFLTTIQGALGERSSEEISTPSTRSSPLSSSPPRQSSPSSGGSMLVKRELDVSGSSGPTPAKRLLADDESSPERSLVPAVQGTHIRIANRGDGRNGDNSLVVSMEINGVMYQGVLFAQSESRSNTAKSSRSIVS